MADKSVVFPFSREDKTVTKTNAIRKGEDLRKEGQLGRQMSREKTNRKDTGFSPGRYRG